MHPLISPSVHSVAQSGEEKNLQLGEYRKFSFANVLAHGKECFKEGRRSKKYHLLCCCWNDAPLIYGEQGINCSRCNFSFHFKKESFFEKCLRRQFRLVHIRFTFIRDKRESERESMREREHKRGRRGLECPQGIDCLRKRPKKEGQLSE